MLKKPVLPLAFLLLASCGNPGPDVLIDLDPRQADYANLRVFLSIPDGIAPQPGSPSFALKADIIGAETAFAEVALVPMADPRGPAWGIDQNDLAQVQRVAAEIRHASTPGTGAVSIGFEGCRRGVFGDAPMEIAVAMRPDAAPERLIEDALAIDRGALPDC